MKDLMLYYHVPFCVSKCAYCAFYSTPQWDEPLLDSYTEALIRQTEGFEGSEGFLVTSVYFGGGTPTVLGALRLCRVLDAVKRCFKLKNGAEITLEANPKTVTYDDLCILRKAGFNRLSLGAQSFNDPTLRLLNRPHTADDFVACFKNARLAGFNNVSVDLIFALPNENEDALSYSVSRLIELKPKHISVYGLSLEEGTPLFENKEKYAFPAEDGEERQYCTLCKLLRDSGYSHYEISNFALDGYEAKHNTGYWKRVPYFGFGAGAHSFFRNRRFKTPRDVTAYTEKTKLGFLSPTDYENAEEITEAEAREEEIMLSLRLAEGAPIALEKVPSVIFETGCGVYENGRLSLTEKGFRVSNAIIGMLMN
ncbi:MAG: radical SAM family heme chaperone HemW [Clostridia bacterium]|nr:radical SAM family heme chaperone HemW [Clostridia bacterium]